MQWPTQPTCHSGDWQAKRWHREAGVIWRAPRTGVDVDGYENADTFRTCSYCGSICPEDLVRELNAGATLGGADWKYGWPHKFYVTGIKSPIAGKLVQRGIHWVNDKRESLMGPASPELFAKFYADHLLDEGYDDEARDALLKAVSQHSGIAFVVADGRLAYHAPYRGFQR